MDSQFQYLTIEHSVAATKVHSHQERTGLSPVRNAIGPQPPAAGPLGPAAQPESRGHTILGQPCPMTNHGEEREWSILFNCHLQSSYKNSNLLFLYILYYCIINYNIITKLYYFINITYYFKNIIIIFAMSQAMGWQRLWDVHCSPTFSQPSSASVLSQGSYPQPTLRVSLSNPAYSFYLAQVLYSLPPTKSLYSICLPENLI